MKKMKISSVLITGFLLTVILAGLVTSAVGVDGGSDLFVTLESMVDVYNENIGDIPFVTSLLGDERINAEIALTDGSTLIIGITTDSDAKITSFEEGAISDPSLRAYTDENTVLAIINSADPVSAAQDALDSGAIRLEGVGVGNKIKVGVMKFAVKMLDLFR